MTRSPLWLSLSLLAACGAPSVDDVKGTAENLSALVEEGYQAVEGSTNNSTAITRLYDALNITWRDLGRDALVRPMVPAWTNSQTTVDTYEKWLMERVFTTDNVESQGSGSITFLVDGRRLCTDPNNPPPNPASLDSCAQTYDQLELRIVASGNTATTVNLDIVLGAGRHKVATLIIEKDRALELRYFSAGYLAWWQAQTMQSAPLAGYGSFTFEGDFSYRFEKLGPKNFALSYSTLSDFKYGFTGTDGVNRSYSMAARAPMYRVRFDGTRGVQEAKVDLGTARYDGVWSDFASVHDAGTPDHTPLRATMQGFTFELSTDAAPAIAKGSLDLGNAPSTVTYGGTEVASVSLARPVTFTVDDDTDGRLKLDFSEIDATAAFHLGRVPNLTVDPAWADETYRVRFNGGTQTLKVAAAQTQVGFKVVSGTFGVEAQNASASVVATGGLCLVSPQMPSQMVPLLKVLAAVPCP